MEETDPKLMVANRSRKLERDRRKRVNEKIVPGQPATDAPGLSCALYGKDQEELPRTVSAPPVAEQQFGESDHCKLTVRNSARFPDLTLFARNLVVWSATWKERTRTLPAFIAAAGLLSRVKRCRLIW